MISLKSARRVGVPLVVVETPDARQTIETVSKEFNGKSDIPILHWDVCRSLTGLNSEGNAALHDIGDKQATQYPNECLVLLEKAPERTLVFFANAQLFWRTEVVLQAIWNLRDVFKSTGSTLVLLCNSAATLPDELKNDCVVMTDTLPNEQEVEAIVDSIVKDAKLTETKIGERKSIYDTLLGLSAFAAEQVLALSLTKDGVNRDSLWERKRKMIEQTPGLSVWRGGEKFADIGGYDNVKTFMRAICKGNAPPKAIVFIDEIEKSMAGSQTDTSGVSQDYLRCLLTWMQDRKASGIILIGPPGCQPKESHVLMADGTWKNVDLIKVGDKVQSPQEDGSNNISMVTNVACYIDREIVEIRTRGRMKISYLCSLDHKVPHYELKRESRPSATANKRPASQRKRATVLRTSRVSELRGKNLRGYRIFTAPAVNFPYKEYAVHPYILGCLLGDGCLTATENGGMVRFVTADKDLVDVMRSFGVIFGKPSCKQGTIAMEYRFVKGTGDAVKALNVWGRNSHGKFIPEEYMTGNLDQRLWLLAGLIDTDGTRDEYSSVSKNLAFQFVELVRSVGGTASIKSRVTMANGKRFLSFRVHFSFCELLPPVQLLRKRQLKRNMSWKNARNRSFEVIPKGRATVFGFDLDSPSKWYITDNWMVTHNSGKSAIAKATGNEAEIPTVSLDLGGMKGSLVGESERRLRSALQVVEAVSQGAVLFIATCNSIGILPPELRRRFSLGTFYFPLPSDADKKKIWDIFLKKFKTEKQSLPADRGWTGAEIENCVSIAWRLDCKLTDAAKYIVPVSVSAGEQIERLGREAHRKYISASYSGLYEHAQDQQQTGRKISV